MHCTAHLVLQVHPLPSNLFELDRKILFSLSYPHCIQLRVCNSCSLQLRLVLAVDVSPGGVQLLQFGLQAQYSTPPFRVLDSMYKIYEECKCMS